MHLKSLRVQGFKTFARKTELTFGRGITAIVGPNGSGKSNLVDAVRWALGEKSARGLRAERMDDVIFAGGPGKAPMGLAEVSLLVDNADHRVPLDFAEIEITRRMYGSGESDYVINGSRARLRDIEMLLAHTGLTQDGYAIVAQNDIDFVIQAAPALRRSILEEAAGVSVLRNQHSETRRRLTDARANLQRARDVLQEITPRVDELRVQAERAEEARSLQSQLETLQGSLQLDQWRKAKQQLRKAEQRQRHLEEKWRETRTQAEDARTRYASAKAEAQALQHARFDRQQAVGELRVELTALEGQRTLARERVATARAGRTESLAARMELGGRAQAAAALKHQVEGELTATRTHLAALRQERDLLGQRAEAELGQLLREAEGALARAQRDQAATQSAHRVLRAQRTAQEAACETAEEELVAARGAVESARARLVALSTLRDRARPVSSTHLAALGARRLRGILNVDAGFSAALEAALERELDAWLADSVADPLVAIERLARADDAREMLLFTLPAAPPAPPPAWAHHPGVLGPARHFVKAPPDVSPLVDRLLEGVWVVEDRATALALRSENGLPATWVTRGGELLTPDRYLGGKAAEPILRLEQELREAERALQLAEASVREATSAHDRARAQREALEEPGKKAARDAEEAGLQQKAAEQRLASLRATSPDHLFDGPSTRRVALSTELSRYEQHAAHLEAQVQRIAAEERQIDADASRLQERAAAHEAVAAQAGAEALQLERAVTEQQRRLAEAERLNWDEAAWDRIQERLRVKEGAHVAAQVAVAHAQDMVAATESERQAAIEAVATAEAQLPESDRVEGDGQLEVDWQRTEREVGRLLRRIEALGPVNPLAPTGFRQAQERAGTLIERVADLESAIQDLLRLMARLRREIDQRFEAVFQAVACNFQEYFGELFDGGRATLRLEATRPGGETSDEEGEAEPGVEILAQTPGKRLQALTLLSGGERALTALAFIFAVQRVNPSPFYVLDEVDAALDDANVVRFNKVLTRLAEDQQFLIVTHNHSTMAKSEVLYGVTLGDHGISKMVSVRLTEVAPQLHEQTA